MGEQVRFRELAEWDWLQSSHGHILHAPAAITVDVAYWAADGSVACGRQGRWYIPGFPTRMMARRCNRCCDALGFPRGTKSPKNDDACRPLVEARLKVLHDVPSL